MKTIEQIKQKHQEELARAEADHALLMALPTPLEAVQVIRVGSIPRVVYRGSWDELIRLLDDLPAIPMGEDRSSGFLTFTPGTHDTPYRYNVDVSQTSPGSYGASVDLRWYAMAGDVLVQISADLKGPDYIGTWLKARPRYFMRGPKSKKVERVYPNEFLMDQASRTVIWGTGSVEAAHHSYLFEGSPAGAIEHLL